MQKTEGYGRGGRGIISRTMSAVAHEVREHAPADVSSSRRDFTMETGSTPTKGFASLFKAVGWMQQLDHNCKKALIKNARPGNRRGIRQHSAFRSSLTTRRFWFLTVSIVLALLQICATELSNEEHHEYLDSREHMQWLSALPKEAHGKYVGHWPHVAAGSVPSLRQSEFLSDTANRRQGFTGTLSDVPSPTDLTVDNQGPLSLILKWNPPNMSQRNFELSGYQLLVQDFGEALAGYFSSIEGGTTTSLVITKESARKLDARNLLGREPPPPLDLQGGMLLRFYLSAAKKGAPGEPDLISKEITAIPQSFLVLDMSGPPIDLKLCSYYTSDGACATESPADRTVRLTWGRPLQQGQGISPTPIAISVYEIQVSPPGDWNHPDTKMTNLTVDISKRFDSAWFKSVPDLKKGAMVVARVRAHTKVGPGDWSGASSPQKVLGVPGSVSNVLAASQPDNSLVGGAFVEVIWLPPEDTGDSTDDDVPIVDYQVQISADSNFNATTPVNFASGQSISGQIQKFRWTNANSGMTFILGKQYFTRIRARNVLGGGVPWSPLAFYFVGPPSMPLIVLATRFKPFSVNISWNEPADRGAKVGGPSVPLLGYDLIMATIPGLPSENGSPPALSANRLQFALPDSQKKTEFRIFENLAKGTTYYVYIRARNTAYINSGNSDWSDGALTNCADGNLLRPSVCGVTAITILDIPTLPINYFMRSAGEAKVMISWDRPSDTGSGSSSYPLLRYDFEYFKDGAEATTLTKVSLFDSNVTYTTPPLNLGDLYKGRIRAVNDVAMSVWTGYLQAYALLTPDPPESVVAVHLGALTIKVDWTRPAQTGLGTGRAWAMLNYELFVNSSCNGDDRRMNLPDAQTSITFSDIVEGCYYVFQVRGQNEAGYGLYRTSSQVRGLSLATKVQNLRAVNDRSLQVNLSWLVPTNIGAGTSAVDELICHARNTCANLEAFSVEVSATQDFLQVQNTYYVKAPGMAIFPLNPGVLYCFRVRFVNLAGLGEADIQCMTPIIRPLLNVFLAPSSNTSGEKITMQISFSLSNRLDVGDQIVVSLPESFILQSVGLLSGSIGEVDVMAGDGKKFCGYLCVPSNRDFFISRKGSGEVFLAGSTIRLALGGITNRRWEGFSGNFAVRTIDTLGNYTKNHDPNVPGYAIVAGAFVDPRASLDATNTGQVTNLKLAFRSPRNPVPPNAIFTLTVGNEMILKQEYLSPGITGVSLSWGTVTSQTLTFSVTDSTVTGSRTADTEIPLNTLMTLTIAGIRNRLTEGSSGRFALKMFTGSGALMDSSENVESLAVSRGTFIDATVAPATFRALGVTGYLFSFKLGPAGLLSDAQFYFLFPDFIMVKDAQFDSTKSACPERALENRWCHNLDLPSKGIVGNLGLSKQGNTFVVQRNDGTYAAPNTALSLPFMRIRNGPPVAVGNITVRTVRALDGLVMEEVNFTFNGFQPATLTGVVHNRNIPVLGGGFVTFSGVAFGPFSLTATTKIGMSTCQSTEWISDSSISGKSAPGVGQTLRISLSVDDAVGSGNGFMSYDSISIERMQDAISDGYGPKVIRGSGHGGSSFTNAARIGYSGCEESMWISDSALTCRSAAGVRGTLGARVTAGVQAGSISEAFSYSALLSVARDKRSNIPTPGRSVMTIDTLLRLNADYTVRSKVGDTTGTSTVWISQTSIRCVMPAGRGDGLSVIMTAAQQPGCVTELVSYDGLQIIEAIDQNSWALNMPTSGKYLLTVRGAEFGLWSTSPGMLLGATAAMKTCWASESAISAMVSWGVGAGYQAKVSVLRQIAELTEVASYNAPLIFLPFYENAMPRVQVNTALRGTTSLIFSGRALGYGDYSQILRSGNTQCQRSIWAAVTSVFCMMPSGTRSSHSLVVTVAVQVGTASGILSYDAPTLSRFSKVNVAATTLGKRIHLYGSNFGWSETSIKGRTGFSSAESTQWASTTSMSCNLVTGIRRSLSMMVTVGGSVASASMALSFDASVLLKSVRGTNGPAAGQPIYIEWVAGNLDRAYSPTIRIGRSASQVTYWATSTWVICKTTPGVGTKLDVVLSVGEQVSTGNSIFTFDSAMITKGIQVNSQAIGGDQLTWSGSSFGPGTNSISLRQGSSQCAETSWRSDSALVCKAMSGSSGRPNALVVSMYSGGGVQTLTNAFSYDGPSVSSMVGGILGVNSSEMMISGKNFGVHDLTLGTLLGTQGCSATFWLSDTSLKCKLKEGYSFSDVPLMAKEIVKICRQCTPFEVTIGCTKSSLGYCDTCQPCRPGFFRDECMTTGDESMDSRGVCLPCKSDGQVGERTFKEIEGDSSTQCELCKVCGGRNQDGTAYDNTTCTTTADATCQPCQPCATGYIRIGCQGRNEGDCVLMDKGRIQDLLGTVTENLFAKHISEFLNFVTLRDQTISLTGDFADEGVTIFSNTAIKYPSSLGQRPAYVIISAVIGSEEMKRAALNGDVVPLTPNSKLNSGSTPIYKPMKLVSNIIYYEVSGMTFKPNAQLNIRHNSTLDDGVVVNAFRWNPDNLSWTELDTVLRTSGVKNVTMAHAPTDRFSAYAVFEYRVMKGKAFDNLAIILPIVITCSLILCCACAVCLWRCRQDKEVEVAEPPLVEASKTPQKTEQRIAQLEEPKSFFLLTDQGPVELHVTGKVPLSPATMVGTVQGERTVDEHETAVFLQASPPKLPVQASPPKVAEEPQAVMNIPPSTANLQRQDSKVSRVEDSLLFGERVVDSYLFSSPYRRVGDADQSGQSNMRFNDLPNLGNIQKNDLPDLGQKSRITSPPISYSSRMPVTTLGTTSRGASRLASPDQERRSGIILPAIPSTDLAMLARGFATPVRASADASRARSQDFVSFSPDRSPAVPSGSGDLESSLAMLAMGFTTPLRMSDASQRQLPHLSGDRESVNPMDLYSETAQAPRSYDRAWQSRGSAGEMENFVSERDALLAKVQQHLLSPPLEPVVSLSFAPYQAHALPAPLSESRAQHGHRPVPPVSRGYSVDDGYNVDDVIVSVGNDFVPHAASRSASTSMQQQRYSQPPAPYVPPSTVMGTAFRQVDTPETFEARVREDYDNETEFGQPGLGQFSIQPGARRFLQDDR